MSTKTEALERLYVRELEGLYRAERQLLEALPRLADAASGAEVRQVLRQVWRETERRVRRLEVIFSGHGIDVTRTRSRLMGNASLIWEAEARVEIRHPEVRDVGLVSVLRRIEGDQASGYRAAAAIARRLGKEEGTGLLHAILDHESGATRELARLDERLVGVRD